MANPSHSAAPQESSHEPIPSAGRGLGKKGSVLVTGAGSGIGRAIAIRFINEGHRVIAVGRRKEPLQELASLYPNQVLPLSCDLTKTESVESLRQELAENPDFHQSLSILVNNAGIFERLSFKDTTDEVWVRMFETNLFGLSRLTRALLNRIEANRGAIVNVSSTLGLRPAPMTSAYSASKAALINLTQSLALELAPSGVRVNCVCPGIVDTPIHSFHSAGSEQKASLAGLQPLGRIGQPEDVAHAVWSLAGPGSEWITGAVLSVDGGINLV